VTEFELDVLSLLALVFSRDVITRNIILIGRPLLTCSIKHCGLPMAFAGDALKDKTGSKIGVKKAYGVEDYFDIFQSKPEWAPQFFSCLDGFNSFLCRGPSLGK
jgi:hypothetical protein